MLPDLLRLLKILRRANIVSYNKSKFFDRANSQLEKEDALHLDGGVGGLTEKRITEIATFQIAAEQMEAYPIRKDFLTALDPTERYEYEDLSELVH